jgi:Flp pilus assembly protein TadG
MRSFWADRAGNSAVLFAVGLPVILAAGAVGTQYSQLVNRRSALQQAADSAAVAGAQQLKLANNSDSVVASVAASTVQANTASFQDTISVDTQVLQHRTGVTVTVSDTVPLSWGKILGINTATVKATSTAQLYGPAGKLCMLSLDIKQGGTLHVEKQSQITAKDCVIYSNSRDKQGVQADSGTTMTASFICSVGGAKTQGATVSPIPTTDCPSMGDPLISRPRPPVGSCANLLPMVITGVRNLYPGDYCGGLTIKGTAHVTLTPGVYVMNNGPLIVQDSATLIGQSAGVYFTGNEGGLRFDPNTTISMTAPKDGVMAGFIFFEDRTVSSPSPLPPGPLGSLPPPPPGSPPMRQYQISSNNASQFLGTFYLPAGRLIVDAKKPVAAQSAYTVIVSRQLLLMNGNNLVLNSDYSSTDVPVPEGVGNATQKVRLAQ